MCENYGGLITKLSQDKDILKIKDEGRDICGTPDNDIDKKTRQAVNLISKRFILKATNRMISNGIASLDDSPSKAVLQSKYPCRGKQLRGAFMRLRGGVAPVTGQLRPAFLIALAEI